MKVEVAVAEGSDSRKDLTIEVPADEVKAEFNKSYQSFLRFAKVPGFRPGHVPLAVVKQRFAKDIKDSILEQLLPHALQHAIQDRNLRVIGTPDITDISLTEGEPFRFKASVEVIPDFTLKPYIGLKLTKQVVKVTDQTIEDLIENLRNSAAQLVPVEDRPSETGDTVAVNLIGKYVEPAEPEDLKADDVSIELGADGVQVEFNENLTGVRADDSRTFRVVYPTDFTSPGLAGKTIDFTAQVVAVRRRELPPLDDDFARQFDESLTLDAWRKQVRENVIASELAEADRRLRDSAIREVAKDYDFVVPATLIEQHAAALMRELAQRLMRSGVSPEAARQMNWQERYTEARVMAERDIRASLVLDRIADDENIEVEDDDIDAEIEKIAAPDSEAIEAVRARLTKEGAVSSIENRLRHRKTVDFIVEKGDVTTEEVSEAQKRESDAELDASQPLPQPDKSSPE